MSEYKMQGQAASLVAATALEANEKLMEFFRPHIERKVAYEVELGRMTRSDAQYVENLRFVYEDSSENEFVFGYEVDEGYYGVNYITVEFNSDFVNDPEGAKVKHEEAMEALRQRKIDETNRQIKAEITRAKLEVAKLEKKLMEGLEL